MTAPAVSQARSLHEICEDVRRAECGACPALPGDECVFTTVPVSVPVTPGTRVRPVRGYHVNRFAIAEADDLITIADMAAILEAAGSFTSTTIIYDDEQHKREMDVELGGGPDDDDLEPYCTECGSWIGVFFGLEGWRHFRCDPLAGGRRQLYDAGHEAVPAWCELPGRVISPADAETIRQALAEAEAARRERAAARCVHREGHPAGACERHVDDLDQADAYAELGRQLGQEADR